MVELQSWDKNDSARSNNCRLERDSQPPARAPNNTATLLGTAVKQFKSIWNFDLSPNLETSAARGVVYNFAIDDGSFRIQNQFGRIGISSRRPNTCKSSWMRHRFFLVTRSQGGNFS